MLWGGGEDSASIGADLKNPKALPLDPNSAE
jgi:hypothetical protein